MEKYIELQGEEKYFKEKKQEIVINVTTEKQESNPQNNLEKETLQEKEKGDPFLLFLVSAIALVVFCIFLWTTIAFGTNYQDLVFKNNFQCQIQNISLEIVREKSVNYRVKWNVFYFKNENKGDYEIIQETIYQDQAEKWKNERKVYSTYPCTLVQNSDTDFTFKWKDDREIKKFLSLYILFLILLVIPIILFILGFVHFYHGKCK